MSLGLIILSDLHIKQSKDKIVQNQKSLFTSIRNELIDCERVLIVVPGDITFSGLSDQYEIALDYFDSLKREFRNYYNNKPVSILFAPGNHDCDFSEKDLSREIIIDKITSSSCTSIDSGIIDICCKPQANYFAFSELLENDIDFTYYNKLLKKTTIKLENRTIDFFVYNMSWVSKINEQYGTITFPLTFFDKSIYESDADISVSVFHHPFNWQTTDNYQEFKAHIINTSTIVVTGHEHHPDATYIDSLQMGNTIIVESGSAQEDSCKDDSEIAIILIDDNKNEINYRKFEYQELTYKCKLEKSFPVARNTFDKHKKALSIRADFIQTLNDIGSYFSHPRKDKLQLSDFFVYPNLQEIDYKNIIEKVEEKLPLSSARELNLQASKKTVIIGNEKSGKTSLLRMKYIEFFEQGYIPIFMNGNELKKHSIDELRKSIKDLFFIQYLLDKDDIEKLLDYSKVVLLIDDFELVNRNKEQRNKFLEILNQCFEYLVISTNDMFFFEERLLGKKSCITGFKLYEIVRFGGFLRRTIVEKWLLLNRYYDTKLEEQREIYSYLGIVNKIIGKNLVPSTPFYLLTIIQTIDMGKPNDLQHSSFGYYYDYLITCALGKAKFSPKDLDSVYNALSCFAYALFGIRQGHMPIYSYEVFFEKLTNEYDLRLDQKEITDKLVESQIIVIENDIVRFKYKYLFYYFMAKYLSLNIGDELIRDQIKELCKSIHREENANILLFLTHLSRDPFIIAEILNNAKTNFSEYEEIQLCDDVVDIDGLIEDLPVLVVEQGDTDAIQKRNLITADTVNNENANCKDLDPSVEIEFTDDDEDLLSLSTKLNSAFKSIDLLGQILKSYYGSLKSELKIDIADEAYAIALRALNSYFSLLKGNLGALQCELVEYFRSKKMTDDERIKKQSRAFIFHLSLLITWSFIKRLAVATGSEDLEKTYNKLLEKNNSIARQVATIAIKLQYSKKIPEAEIIGLHNETKRRFLPNTVLKEFVAEFLYLYDIPQSDRQRICDKIDLKYRLSKELEYRMKK